MRQLLKTYSISKVSKGNFILKFTTTGNVLVSFDSDKNTISLSEGATEETEFSQNYKSVKGKLHIGFLQNFGTAKKEGVEDPVIIIQDSDLP